MNVVIVDMYKSGKMAEKLGISQAPALALITNREVCYRTTKCTGDTCSIEEEINKICC